MQVILPLYSVYLIFASVDTINHSEMEGTIPAYLYDKNNIKTIIFTALCVVVHQSFSPLIARLVSRNFRYFFLFEPDYSHRNDGGNQSDYPSRLLKKENCCIGIALWIL